MPAGDHDQAGQDQYCQSAQGDPPGIRYDFLKDCRRLAQIELADSRRRQESISLIMFKYVEPYFCEGSM